jgi:hypothetical protein
MQLDGPRKPRAETVIYSQFSQLKGKEHRDYDAEEKRLRSSDIVIKASAAEIQTETPAVELTQRAGEATPMQSDSIRKFYSRQQTAQRIPPHCTFARSE